ncbi:MAG: Plug domain-containing protein, partial [Sediminibacterium sp.]
NTTVIDKDKMDKLPAVGRNLYEYLRFVPQAKLVDGNEAAVSFAGQNNRYNAFYIDGSVNNDVFGLAASGTNGGQAGISVLSVDAIEQFQVAVSPYDASIGNFTGAAINAVTRSGTNQKQSSFYHFFSNRDLAGKTPAGLQEEAVKQDHFSSNTYGLRLQGPIQQNRIFYFVNIELQREIYSKPFSFDEYKGNTNESGKVTILANTIKGTYQYDPGPFIDNPEYINADRVVTRFDWNINQKNSISISNRYTYAQRMHTNTSNANTIHFSNDGYAFLSRNHSVSVEFKSSIGPNKTNKLLLTYANVKDDREPLLKAFPRVRINDGEGAFIFGTDNSSTINMLTQENWTLFDKHTFTTGRHAFNMGIDLEYNKLRNAFIQNSFGSYTYYSLEDFLTNKRPSAYQTGFSMIDTIKTDHTSAAAAFAVLRASIFVNDEIRYNKWVLNFGLRMDQHRFLNSPVEDDYTNHVALPAFEKYYDLEGARSGRRTIIPVSLSPRLGFTYRLLKIRGTLRGGIGIFSGRLPFAWPGGSYNNNGLSIGGFTANISQLNTIRFRSDPYHQWTVTELGATVNKEPLDLTSAKFSMPKLLRASLAIDKKIGDKWSADFEIMYSKNLTEIKYTNVNILPHVAQAAGPDNRNIYSAINNAKIPLNTDSSNPYDHVILLGNNTKNTGYAYELTASLNGHLYNGWELGIKYHFGHSVVTNEGTSSVNLSQWRSIETVNGRNELSRSVSDFSQGHRLQILVNRMFNYSKRSMTSAITFAYTLQSGSPVSYVYGNFSMTRDDGVFGNYDLVYIPSVKDLEGMVFLPNKIEGVTYSSQQQKESLENYIQHDVYLRKHRGSYAERNAGRTPFTGILDVKLKHTMRIKQYELQLTCDIYNFSNILNRNWGRRYDQPGDQIPLLDFAGYTNSTGLTPQFRFNPLLIQGEKWDTSASSVPVYSARWNARLGLRITFK